MGRAIDIDKLCTDLMERWDIADKQKEELVKQVMADIVTPIVVSQPTIEPEIVRCKDCKNWGDDDCPMRFIEQVEYDDDGYIEHDDIIHDYTKDDGFCDRAERRTDGSD